jgi:hypothetical protein
MTDAEWDLLAYRRCWMCGGETPPPRRGESRFCSEPCEIAFRREHGDPEDLMGP